MAEVKQTIELIGRSLLEEKAKHGPLIVATGSGLTIGTIIGYVVAAFAFLSTLYVMYKTKKEIELISIRIDNEKQKKEQS